MHTCFQIYSLVACVIVECVIGGTCNLCSVLVHIYVQWQHSIEQHLEGGIQSVPSSTKAAEKT